MTERLAIDPYGRLTEPATLTIERLLPGPASRIWAYLTDADMRRKWLADGEMEQKAGASFELVWRNDELSDQPSTGSAGGCRGNADDQPGAGGSEEQAPRFYLG